MGRRRELGSISARILIASADATHRAALSQTLWQAGFVVVEAEDSAAPVEQLSASDLDMAILVVDLPDSDGVDLCRLIKANPATSTIPVIVLAPSSLEAIDAARVAGSDADAFLLEPLEPEVLVAAIRSRLGARPASPSRTRAQRRREESD